MKKNINTVLGLGFLSFALGVITGLLMAKKSGRELQKDAQKKMKKLQVESEKGLNTIKSNIRDIKHKFDSKQMPELNPRLTETFHTIKETAKDLGEKLIKQ